MKNNGDCVDMKHEIQSKIFEEIKSLSREEQLQYFKKAGDDFWKEIEQNREKRRQAQEQKSA